MSFVTLEEHFISPSIPHSTIWERSGLHLPELQDLEGDRLASMNTNSISTQILSHVPPYQHDHSPAECTAINDHLASVISRHPTRFAGFATLPMRSPQDAVSELHRCITTHNFVGSLVDNNLADNTFYDGPVYRPVFAEHQRLDVPMYIHPCFPSEDVFRKLYAGGTITDNAAFMLSIAGYGWHAMCGLHVLRLFAAGVFDDFPRLKIVIGHEGELLPMNLARAARAPTSVWGTKRSLQEVWEENIWVTTSGQFSLGPFRCLLETKSVERIMFSVDYPFSRNEQGVEFMREVRESGLLSGEEWEAVAGGNARKLLRLPD